MKYTDGADCRLIKTMKVRGEVLSVALWLGAVSAVAQSAPPSGAQCDVVVKKANGGLCPPAGASAPAKSTAQEFPFPGESPSTADKPADAAPDAPSATPAQGRPKLPEYPGDPDAPTAAPAQGKPKLPAYPGDPDAPAATKSGLPAYPGDPDASSSSSSSSGNPAFDPDAPDKPADGDGPLKDAGSSGDNTKAPSRRRKIPKVDPETPESRVAKDLSVAGFYMNDGNFTAAYARAKDAVQYQPDYADTHFALAEAARKLGKNDEAKSEYEKTLTLDPIPKQEKASKVALEELAKK